MTLEEFKEKVNESRYKDDLLLTEFTVEFSFDDEETFKGVIELFKFVDKQVKEWKKIDKEGDIYIEFEYLQNNIIKYVELHSTGYSLYNKHIKNKNFVKYESDLANFLIEVHKKYPRVLDKVKQLILTNNDHFNSPSSFDQLLTILLVYEYRFGEETIFTKRSKNLKGSITRLKKDFIELTKKFESDSKSQIDEFEVNSKNHLQGFDEKSKALQDGIREDFDREVNHFKERKDKFFEDFERFKTSASEKKEELEKTYEELLRLEAPIKYWKDRGDNLNKQAWRGIKILIVLVLVAGTMLFSLLWLSPEEMLHSFFSDDKTAAVRWSIIFLTLMSLFIFGIRTVTRVIFSSFHLARDAEEREKLTYVYLALLKDKKVEESDRTLILQSLFSRADTGLLKGDSSPTLPTTEIIKNITKVK